MAITGIDAVTYGCEDLGTAKKFYLDWGLSLVREAPDGCDFECLNGAQVQLRRADDPALPPALEPGSTVREVVWGTDDAHDFDAMRASLARFGAVDRTADRLSVTDPNGLTVYIRRSRKRPLKAEAAAVNTFSHKARIDQPGAFYARAEPADLTHVVFLTDRLAEVERFYVEGMGFSLSDRYTGRGIFLRSSGFGGHHDIFFLQLPKSRPSFSHLAFSVRDIHEVFGGGLQVSRCGWTTEVGPGRHRISSAYFWYFKCPAGGSAEYNTDEDHLTPAWAPREIAPTPDNYAEWLASGSIDIRAQKANLAASDQH